MARRQARRWMMVTLGLALAAPSPSPAAAAAVSPAVAALDDLLTRMEGVRALAYRFVKRERLRDGTVTDSEHQVKWMAPGRVYMATLRPRAGQEVIFDPGRDPRKVVVHPGRFPDLTLHLDLDGTLATSGEHHLVSHVGFAYLATILRRSTDRARREPRGEEVSLERRCDEGGRCLDHLALTSGQRPAAKVLAHDGEPLVAFAERNRADPYALVYVNPDIPGLSSRLHARAYLVPAYYGSRTELVIDPVTGLPAAQTVWDEAGRLYEQYEFLELLLDPPLTDADFDPGNRAYRF